MHGFRRGLFRLMVETNISNICGQAPLVCMVIALALFGVFSFVQAQSTPVIVGYRDFNYGSTVISTPTAQKPESKLWWNDGFWWGSLWDPAANKYRIHRFDISTQSWINVGPDLDNRNNSLADALWDGQHLYVASHIYSGNEQEPDGTTPANSARLYRFSYNPAADAYSLDAGFPILVNSAKSETLVLDKDSTGKLWVTWTQANNVYINRSLGDDLTWGTPFVLPVQGADLHGDDISTLIAFGGDRIGVMWSNQNDSTIYFAVHHDNQVDTNWEPREVALSDANLGAVADDHLNIKEMSDGSGDLYAVTKTSLGNISGAPDIFALKRAANGVWTNYVVANSDKYTRPVMMLDEENREIYVFASSDGKIRMKKASLDNINFPTGAGETFIQSATDKSIDNPAAAKHNVNSTTGLMVLASNSSTRYYLHNYITLPGVPPAIAAFTPTSGPVGTAVTITGSNFSGATSVAFNGIVTTNFTVDSNIRITATVPEGATTGKISIVKPVGTDVSANDFTTTGGHVLHKETVTGASSNSNTVTTSTNLTGASGHLYLAAIATRAKVKVNSVTGLGLSWTLMKAQCSGQNTTGIEVWVAQATPGEGTPSGNGVVTATLASVPHNAVIAVSRYAGVVAVNPIGNVIAGNTNGINGACSAGVNTSAYSFNLATTIDGSVVYVAATMRGLTHAPEAGYAERAEILHGGAGATASVAVEDKRVMSAATVTVDGAFSGSVDWAMAAVALQPATQFTLAVNTAGSGSVTLDPTLSGGVYGTGATVTLTATPSPGYQFTGWSGDLSGWNNPATITMDANKNITAVFASSEIIHQETQTGSSSNSTTVMTSSSLIGASGQFYLAAIATRWKAPVLSVSGLGLSWTLVKAQCAGQNSTGIEVWMAQGTPSGNGTVTATLSGAPSNAVIAVSRYSGVEAVNPIGNVVSGNTNGTNGVCTGGVNSNAYSFNLATTRGDEVMYCAATMRGSSHTPGIGFTERTEILHGSVGVTASVAVQDKSVPTASTAIVDGIFSASVDWAMVALALKPQSNGIVHQETQTGSSSNSTTVMTSANLTGVNDHLYLAAIATRWKVGVLSVSGLGLNWTLVKTQCSGQSTTGIEVWKAQGTPSGNGAVTAALASVPSNAVIAVSRYSGVDTMNPVGDMVSGNSNGVSGACTGGVNTNAYAFNLVPQSGAGAMVYGAATMRGLNHTPGTEYAERAEILHGGSGVTASVAVEDKKITTVTTAVDGAFSGSVDWAMVGFEIKPQMAMSKQGLAAKKIRLMPPAGFVLEPNYPNPFSAVGAFGHPSTLINFSLPARGNVVLNIYNETGQLIRTLVDGEMAAGRHALSWNGRNQFGQIVAAGMYLYRMMVQTENGDVVFNATKRMILIK